MLLLVLVDLSGDVVHPLLQLLVIFLGKGPLVDRVDDVLLPVEETAHPRVVARLLDRFLLVASRVEPPEDVLRYSLGILR